ncbi:MAG: hypothetical protein D6681_02775 [Calditrichaeota bacterium]|nr:MAG: hypothetical protein D6681_02775 [Calditrichota bacterium]
MKKFLRYPLIVLAVLIVGFLLIGVFVPEFSYENRLVINAPVEKAFAVFIDTSYTRRWLSGFKRFEHIQGEPLQPGSKWRLIIEEQGEVFELTEEMTDYRENERFAFVLEADVLTSEVTIRFQPLDSTRCEMIATTRVRGKGMLWKSLLPLFKSGMQSHAQRDYEKLKGLMEATERVKQ